MFTLKLQDGISNIHMIPLLRGIFTTSVPLLGKHWVIFPENADTLTPPSLFSYIPRHHCSQLPNSLCCPIPRQAESEMSVAQLCPNLCEPMDCSLPGPLSMEFSRQECCHSFVPSCTRLLLMEMAF